MPLCPPALTLAANQLPLTFRIQRVVDDKFPREDFVIGQPELAEAEGDPLQTRAGRMRIRGRGIRGPHNFAEQLQRRVLQVMVIQQRFKGDPFAAMVKLGAGRIKGRGPQARGFGQYAFRRDKDKLRRGVNEALDQSRTGDAVDFHMLTGDPFHGERKDAVLKVAGTLGPGLRGGELGHGGLATPVNGPPKPKRAQPAAGRRDEEIGPWRKAP